MDVIDYGQSFIQGRAPENRVRFWVESRTRIIDEEGGTVEDYYQCGSCKSEHTFAEKDLFVADNYDFLPIFGPSHGVVFRRHARVTTGYRQILPADQWWSGLDYYVTRASNTHELASNEEIRAATHRMLPIVAQTEIADEGTGLRAIIECPVKTMNIIDETNVYQVDTGPVAFPDLSKRAERTVELISPAYVAFNTPHFADFVIEAPTNIAPEGAEPCEMYHYSKIVSLPAANRLFCIGGLDAAQ